MNKNLKHQKGEIVGIDTRIVLIGCRDPFTNSTLISENVSNSYYSFSHCNYISVLPVEYSEQPAMKSAYSSINDKLDYKSKFFLAFTDIIQERTDSSSFGYTKKEIDDFWNNDESPLFFLTMVNLSGTHDIKNCIKKIRNDLNGSNYIAYLTYDYCDIIIFCRENCFTNYSNKMLNFAYSGKNRPIGTFTLYGFNESFNDITNDNNEFQVLINLSAEESNIGTLCKEIDDLDRKKKVERKWFFGRKDFGLICRNATIKWLFQVRYLLQKISDKKEISFDLLITVGDGSFETSDNHSPQKLNCLCLKDKLNNRYEVFKELYISVHENLNLTPDYAWLRWLKNSADLSFTFIENYISVNLGTCLVPQFLDLFDYGIKYFETIKGSSDKSKCNFIESISMSFSKFFSYVAILIDSMNQSDIQFLQIPSFRFPSFEVPPKVMEYYIAVAHKLTDFFHDDEENIYKLLVTPQFINKLGVKSIADQRLLKHDQWLEIVISESSFYSLRITTQILAHEISHFVGQDNRCRNKRKESVLKFAFVSLIYMILEDLENELNDKNYNIKCDLGVSISSVKSAAESLCDKTSGLLEDFGFEHKNYMTDLESLFFVFADKILNSPKVYELFFEKIKKITKENVTTTFGTLGKKKIRKSRIKKFRIKFRKFRIKSKLIETISDFLLFLFKKDFNIESKFSDMKKDLFLNNLVKDKLNEIIKIKLSKYIIEHDEDNGYDISGKSDERFTEFKNFYTQSLDYFKETFADLQAIMVFNMTWTQYYEMLKYEKPKQKKTLIPDIPLRMLAIAKVLSKKRFWKKEEITDYGDEDLKKIVTALNLDIYKDTKIIEEELKFNAPLLLYLCYYLEECFNKIKECFSESHRKTTLSNLRELHEALSSNSVYEAQLKIGKFVEEYRNEILQNDKSEA